MLELGGCCTCVSNFEVESVNPRPSGSELQCLSVSSSLDLIFFAQLIFFAFVDISCFPLFCMKSDLINNLSPIAIPWDVRPRRRTIRSRSPVRSRGCSSMPPRDSPVFMQRPTTKLTTDSHVSSWARFKTGPAAPCSSAAHLWNQCVAVL